MLTITEGAARKLPQRTHDALRPAGAKEAAYRYRELICNVGSASFYNHGGYKFVTQFYHEAYRAATKIVGGITPVS